MARGNLVKNYIMGLIQNVAVIALFSGAYMSNPDEESFKRFLELEYRKYLKISYSYWNSYYLEANQVGLKLNWRQ